ncbi:maltose excess protein 1, chloroplastic isoform X4 [Selaginella moellendorffii]|uniref:maltose excess protein 1, chloroplastic isoform X4 n=2 Tax=Selaginella moellendorffii TaxID=88036 RepID=UPI000D1C96D6|nr:maltose excess protein 1, chloroplastic isoform X4 [Selaginella moellendorffii]|eukprot:XP_024519558.1 maltose excess protein 1, chloroplastic isoform X4 [Selaginella moellendorffii]
MPRCRLWCRLKWWFCCCCCCCTDSGDTFPAQKMNANSILVIVSQTRRLLTNFLSFFQLFAFSTEARLSMQVVPRSFLMASSSNSNSYRELEDGDDGEEDDRQSLLLLSWNSTTIHLAEFATLPFLFLQLPQIILNARNLIAGNYEALSAVQWMGQLTSLLGNLSLLSYFAGRRERGAMAVQAVGVLTTLVVLIQLGIAGAMPSLALAGTVIAVAFGLLLNLLNYLLLLREWLWKIWEAVISVGGATVLLQVMWSTFEPHIPHTILPAVITGCYRFLASEMVRLLGCSFGMDCNLALHVDAGGSNVPEFYRPREHQGLVTLNNSAGHDWQWTSRPSGSIHQRSHVVHRCGLGDFVSRLGTTSNALDSSCFEWYSFWDSHGITHNMAGICDAKRLHRICIEVLAVSLAGAVPW